RVIAIIGFVLGFVPAHAADDYELGPQSQRHEGVPRGTVSKQRWTDSRIFPGTQRDYWIYVPAQYDRSKPSAVMVFQDGHGYVDEKGSFRVPVVFDNLIHAQDMPVTIGIFINPGLRIDDKSSDKDAAKKQRSVEYDTLSDAYA